jgi:TatA/E family protein of Tat protein translocase
MMVERILAITPEGVLETSMGPLGWQETIFIFVLALLIFGPKKLPELGKTIGKAMTEFRRASSDLRSTWDREMHALEKETESVREVTQSYDHQIQSSYDDGYSYYDSGYEGSGDAGKTDASTTTDSSTVGAPATQGADQNATDPNAAAATAVAEAAPPAQPQETTGAAAASDWKPGSEVKA